jgi:tyrosine-specific transport protein
LKVNRLAGSILIIVGTSIGAGTLALPVAISGYGLLGTLGLLFLAWLCMTLSALLILEVNLCLPTDTNLISMARDTLGTTGQAATWLSYLLLFYTLIAAYVLGMGDILQPVINHLLGDNYSTWVGSLLVVALLGILLFAGAALLDMSNRLLMLGLVFTFVLLFYLLFQHIHIDNYVQSQRPWVIMAWPIAVVAYGFHNVIPGVRAYLHSDVKKIRLAIIIGSLCILGIYVLWTLLVIGVVPYEGAGGLASIMQQQGDSATNLASALHQKLAISKITLGFQLFAFFAIATSLLGVSFSMFDFLSDGFAIDKTKSGKLLLLCLTFLPPLLIGYFYDKFIGMLEYGALFIAIILLAIPALMAWSSRKKAPKDRPYQVFGGKFTVWFVLFCAAMITIIVLAPRLSSFSF